MATTQQISVTLSSEMAAMVREKVAKGEYTDESEVIRDGLRNLFARDLAMEDWLHEEVAPALDALRSCPTRAVPASRVRAVLEAEYAKTASHP